MIQVKYIMQLPAGKTVLDVLNLPDASELVGYFGIWRAYAESNNCTVTSENDPVTNITTYTYNWQTQADLDQFYTFANSLTDYSQFATSVDTLVAQLGGSLNRTEQEM